MKSVQGAACWCRFHSDSNCCYWCVLIGWPANVNAFQKLSENVTQPERFLCMWWYCWSSLWINPRRSWRHLAPFCIFIIIVILLSHFSGVERLWLRFATGRSPQADFRVVVSVSYIYRIIYYIRCFYFILIRNILTLSIMFEIQLKIDMGISGGSGFKG